MDLPSREPPSPPGALPAPDARSRRIARSVFAAALAILALWVARPYVAALAWAVVIAIAVWPLYARFVEQEPQGPRKVLAPLAFTLLIGLVLVLPLATAAVEIGRESQTLVEWTARAQQNGLPVPPWVAKLPLVGTPLDRWWVAHLANPSAELFGGLDRSSLASWSGAFGGRLLRGIFLSLLTFMGLFLLLRDGARISERLLEVIDRWLGDPGERLAEKMVSAVRGTVNGTVLVAVGEGALIGVGYLWAGVPHAVLFAILTMTFAMVPLGAWIAFTAAALALVAEEGSTIAAAAVFGWGAIVMLIGDNFVQPALIGGAARLPFLWALIGIFGGVEAFGLVGLFIGPVIMAALLTVWREWVAMRQPEAP